MCIVASSSNHCNNKYGITNLCIHSLKVRADTTLTEGEWSDEIIVVISSSETESTDSSDSSDSSVVAYVVGFLLGGIAIIVTIGLFIFLIHTYRNRIKYHDTYVSTLTTYPNISIDNVHTCVSIIVMYILYYCQVYKIARAPKIYVCSRL